MAYSTTEVRKKIDAYVSLLRRDIKVNKIILFGSYAWGSPKPYSDIDLAVFSSNFRDKDEIENMQYLFKKACQIDPAIEPHPYHPKDLKKLDRRTLLYRIVREGKKISLKH